MWAVMLATFEKNVSEYLHKGCICEVLAVASLSLIEIF